MYRIAPAASILSRCGARRHTVSRSRYGRLGAAGDDLWPGRERRWPCRQWRCSRVHARHRTAKHQLPIVAAHLLPPSCTLSVTRLRRPLRFVFPQIQASLSEYYGKLKSEGGKPTGSGRAGKGGEESDVGVLTRVLDLARPVICALGPLMTHLQVRRGVAAFLSTYY